MSVIENIQELHDRAVVIRNETEDEQNSAIRVGGLLVDMVDTLNKEVFSNSKDGLVPKPESNASANKFLNALGNWVTVEGGGGGGTSLNEPLLSMNSSGLGQPTSSQNGQCLVWDQSANGGQGAWKYGNAGGSAGTVNWDDINDKPTTLEGYGIADVYTKTECNSKFMTITAFERLFRACDANNNKVNHPYDANVSSIKALYGLWTEQYLSALGQNSSGGGGGGGTSLYGLLNSINTSSIGSSAPGEGQDGQSIMYDHSNGTWKWYTPGSGSGSGAAALYELNDVAPDQNNQRVYGLEGTSKDSGKVLMMGTVNNQLKWYAGTVQNGTVTSVAMSVPNGFTISGSPITSSGTLSLNFSSGYSLPRTSDVENGVTAYNWGNHANAGYATQLWVQDQGYLTASAISDMATKTWVGKQGFLTGITSQMVTNALGYTPVSNATTWWGRSVSNNMVVGHIDMNNRDAVRFKAKGGDGEYWNCLTMNNENTLALGYYTRTHGQYTDIQGGNITFAVNGGSGTASSPIDNRVDAMSIDVNGRVWIRRAVQGLRIGDGLITWDNENHALKVERITGSSTTAGNFYATGAVSALGFQSGSSGSASVNTLTINTQLDFEKGGETATIYVNNNLDLCLSSPNYINTEGTTINTAGGSVNLNNGDILNARRVYFGSNSYLFVDSNNKLKFFDGQYTKTVQLV